MKTLLKIIVVVVLFSATSCSVYTCPTYAKKVDKVDNISKRKVFI